MTENMPARTGRNLRKSRARGGDIRGQIRDEVALSWRRSALHGLRREHVEAPYEPDLDFGGRFAAAAGPVADQLSDDLAGTDVALMLSDERAGMLDRRVPDLTLRVRLDAYMLAPGFRHGEEHVGTNAIGTALRQAAPVAIWGGEHFADTFTGFACSAAPITDPQTGMTLGVVGLACAAERGNPLMLPLVKRARQEIEQRLLDDIPVADRVLIERFVAARRRAKGPLLSVSAAAVHANASAARLLQPADQVLIWDWAARVLPRSGLAQADLRLASGLLVTARARAVRDGGDLVGALVRFDAPDPGRTAAPAGPVPARPTFGWDSLTDTERGVAAIITEGVTNREAAARLYLSRHTIDYHLRQIFRKLDVTSRVELTRLVLAEAGPRDDEAAGIRDADPGGFGRYGPELA